MNDNEINIAIAEACPTLFQIIGRETHWRLCFEGEDSRVRICGDLNAMHEAEKALNGKGMEYATELKAVMLAAGFGFGPQPEHYLWHATARQRAEAFLRTLGKWRE